MFKYNILESEIGLSGLKPLKIAALASFNKHLQRVREAHETLKKVILECRQYPDHLYLQGIASHGPTLVASQSKLDLLEIEQCAFNRENGTCISSKKRVFLAEPA